MKRSLPLDFEPRADCPRCGRAVRVCYCAHLTSIPTKTRVVLLQHPREEDMAIGTARMASLCLPNSELHVGVDFEQSQELTRVLHDPKRPAVLLYPSDSAVTAADVFENPPKGPVTLVVVDGTWWQARKLVRTNPRLAALPRIAFKAKVPSEYRIRREPDEAYVSTIEALASVLGVLEGEPERLRALLVPFRAMIDAQIEFATKVRVARHRKGPVPVKRPRVPLALSERPESIVCVTAEANAWPYRNSELRTSYREELVHLVAHRPHTGETLDIILKPRNPLAPSTPPHVGLSVQALDAGEPLSALCDQWRAFVREGDVLCSWGYFAVGLLKAAAAAPDLNLPAARLDLRQVARVLLEGRAGTMEAVLEKLAVDVSGLTAHARGRAGARSARLARIASHLRGLG